MRGPTVRIITLGCAKNDVDSEEITGVLLREGYRVSAGTEWPQVTIVNTCGFIESAKLESIQAIRKAIRTKGHGKVIVAGCLVQRMGPEMARLCPGADAYVGVGQMAKFAQIVSGVWSGAEGASRDLCTEGPPQHLWADVPTRPRSSKPWSAYLKISEGCDHQCSFCTIPSFRGRHASKPIERVLEEAHHLVKHGARELNLIAQDVTQYGFDLYQAFTLPKLLRELNQIDDLGWIRLLYYYPNRLTDEVIECVATLEKVLPYVDIPLQHVHPDTLRRMKRPWDGERYLALFAKLRAAVPDVAIRTTLIVGFPGETDAEFRALLDFVKEAHLDRVGAFIFSREPGTPSFEMPDQVPSKVKKHRYDELMRLQQGISLQRNIAWQGRELSVLTEAHVDGWTVGRSFRDAPEIDGVVYLPDGLPLGEIMLAQVTGATEYDLVADPVVRQSMRLLPTRRSSVNVP